MSESKDNWLIATIKFILGLLQTGNDRVDRMIQSFVLICVLGTLLLFVLGMFMGQVGDTVPGILNMVGAFFQACMDWLLSFVPSGGTDVSAVNQIPAQLHVTPTDVPFVPAE